MATAIRSEAVGMVYAKPWVVDLVFDLAGYTADRRLADNTLWTLRYIFSNGRSILLCRSRSIHLIAMALWLLYRRRIQRMPGGDGGHG